MYAVIAVDPSGVSFTFYISISKSKNYESNFQMKSIQKRKAYISISVAVL